MDLYIYYKVAEGDTAPLHAAVTAMQATLAREHGIDGQLKRRPEANAGVQTWMEVYAGVADGFAATLAQAAADASLARWTVGPRHIEIFTDAAPCA